MMTKLTVYCAFEIHQNVRLFSFIAIWPEEEYCEYCLRKIHTKNRRKTKRKY
jgi:hypothetical protein